MTLANIINDISSLNVRDKKMHIKMSWEIYLQAHCILMSVFTKALVS